MTYSANRAWMYYQQDGIFPPGYRRVEYLESTGQQYIDSGWMLDANDKVKLHIRVNQVVAHSGIFGSYTNSNNGYYVYQTATGALQAGYGSKYYTDGLLPVGEYHLEADSGKIYVDGELKINITGATFAAQTRTAYLFWYNYNTSDSKMIGRYYSAVILDGDGKVRSYVPCVRISDSKPGLYDLCGSICPLTLSPFYINAGTGDDFTWGELQ